MGQKKFDEFCNGILIRHNKIEEYYPPKNKMVILNNVREMISLMSEKINRNDLENINDNIEIAGAFLFSLKKRLEE